MAQSNYKTKQCVQEREDNDHNLYEVVDVRKRAGGITDVVASRTQSDEDSLVINRYIDEENVQDVGYLSDDEQNRLGSREETAKDSNPPDKAARVPCHSGYLDEQEQQRLTPSVGLNTGEVTKNTKTVPQYTDSGPFNDLLYQSTMETFVPEDAEPSEPGKSEGDFYSIMKRELARSSDSNQKEAQTDAVPGDVDPTALPAAEDSKAPNMPIQFGKRWHPDDNFSMFLEDSCPYSRLALAGLGG